MDSQNGNFLKCSHRVRTSRRVQQYLMDIADLPNICTVGQGAIRADFLNTNMPAIKCCCGNLAAPRCPIQTRRVSRRWQFVFEANHLGFLNMFIADLRVIGATTAPRHTVPLAMENSS
ncbi:hypothetical protein FIBSPDRAFT_166196 [Athelia psychrophila]|uniref:Uncharacterized protein n=1 Tax=Athelia psychrophila TaxID=1759441 RepID=A0A166B0J0_9AGAM|nr:hypothetical protein FIBSPDRAFT_166196 [Fibularhizoctonia sp. CBS 109695]